MFLARKQNDYHHAAPMEANYGHYFSAGSRKQVTDLFESLLLVLELVAGSRYYSPSRTSNTPCWNSTRQKGEAVVVAAVMAALVVFCLWVTGGFMTVP